jgi:NAD(P)-dependent dehydrogenase (short-subunit alcohol dehydrogenase family)
MDLDLKGRVAVITGGGTGIGKAIAEQFLREGASVVISGRRQQVLAEAAAELEKKTGGKVLSVVADTTDWQSVKQLASQAADRFGRLDIMINSAAAPSGAVRSDLGEADDALLLHDINTKVVGYFRCSKAALPYMLRQKWGRIINIGGLTARSTEALSGMRNAAIVHMTKTLSDQLGPHGITVNVVHPGITATEHILEMYQELARKKGVSVDEITAPDVKDTPIRRLLEPDEIAHAVLFLCSPKAGAITGESIAVDGGYTRGIYM